MELYYFKSYAPLDANQTFVFYILRNAYAMNDYTQVNACNK
ncbi:hypothetical protein [Pseudoalteromonas denitrificans]|nr:hypothetical protein [Pseudoalteromonas denitrificans]